ncbi:histone lysine methyltransferase Set9 [Paramarasmius palmivorus]|uniref:Histone lysine methyltransferase Set9 n=1 Tax=Paramarasmius palmivorus TaxID=297713 RepID=A0AAW0DQN3_9AGAR
MNMRDLSKDDDFVSHLLVEKLGTGSVPLLVHKMDPSRRLPKVQAKDLLDIVRRLVTAKGPAHNVIRQAVDELLSLMPIRYYLQNYTQKQINAFATHASRYFELYQPGGSIEISHTCRYSHRTGKSELCILATKALAPGTVITELKGSMANLTDEEDKELKRSDIQTSDIRRDFSVIHSKSMKKNHLFLGPARFVNHDCDNNCELFREGRYITFRVIKPISIGEEITAHYGDGYFGKKNRHCLCETCEKNGRGGYAPFQEEDAQMSDSSSDSDSSSSDAESEEEVPVKKPVNLDERRTRRGVYAIVNKEDDLSDESDNEDENILPLAGAIDIPSAVEIELSTEASPSGLTSLSSSRAPSKLSQPPQAIPGSSTVDTEPSSASRAASSLSSLSSVEDSNMVRPSAPKSNQSTPFRSIISTRRQKAIASGSAPDTPTKRSTRSVSTQISPSKGKGKAADTSSRSSISIPFTLDKGKEKEGSVKIKKEEVELRLLRTRPPLPSPHSESTSQAPSKTDIPRGPDGKPLPLCGTCNNVLPVISVDQKVVWGLQLEKKKKTKPDCPRCMRHLAIYGQPWPRRMPLPGTASTFALTPREEGTPVDAMRRVTQKALPTLDRKLAAAANSKRKRQSEDEDPNEKPAKKAKIAESATPKSAKNKAQKAKPVSEPEPPKRKRGRPRLTSPRAQKNKQQQSTVIVKMEEEEISLNSIGFKDQPRKTDGRFEKKSGKSSPQKIYIPGSAESSPGKTREQRALEREKQKARLEKEGKNKRSSEGGDAGLEDSPLRKKSKHEEPPPLRMYPRPSLVNRGSNLFSKPNPMRFAARAWAGPLVADDGTSSEEDKGPVTPEDSAASSPAIEVVDADPAPLAAPSLTYKPSPFNFARRRWSSQSRPQTEEPVAQPDDTAETLPNPVTPELMSPTTSDSMSVLSGTSEILESRFATLPTSTPPVTRLVTSAGSWDDIYSEEEEDVPLYIIPPSLPASMIVCKEYTSALPADNPSQKYPPLVPLRKRLASISSPHISATPNFIDAGWDDIPVSDL